MEAGWWVSFSEQFDLHFDTNTGKFKDISELAHAMYIVETYGSEEDKEHLRELKGDTLDGED